MSQATWQPARSCALVWRIWTLTLNNSQVRRAIAGLDLPNNPLDELIDRLGGPPVVAEMTGRKGRLVRRRNGEQGVKVRPRNPKSNTSPRLSR